jgi:hydrogenase expression/formation protein HypC
MCLGVPGRVIAVEGDVATVDFWGLSRPIRLDIVDQKVAPGDWVLNHVGFAIRRIPASEIAETLALYDTLLAAKDDEDFMARDVKNEIAASNPELHEPELHASGVRANRASGAANDASHAANDVSHAANDVSHAANDVSHAANDVSHAANDVSHERSAR